MNVMNIKHTLKATGLALVLVAGLTLLPVRASAIAPGSIPYNGDATQGPNFPAFNIYNGVPSVGNEADFIRVKKDGEPNSTLRNSVDTACNSGDRFDVWFYVHNGANPGSNNNGSGPGVARNVVAKVVLPQGEQVSFPISGGVTASNAEAINDSATINCGGKQFRMKYVDGSAQAFLDLPNKVVPLPSSIVSSGTPIGTNLLDGNVWGCWEQRVWMSLKVEVEAVTPAPATAKCELFTLTTGDNRKVIADQFKTSQTGGATLKSVTINWGDNTAVTTINDVNQVKGTTHQYASNGSYTVTAVATFAVPNAADITSGGQGTLCIQQVNFVGGQPPAVTTTVPTTPTTLVNTGAGSIAALFGAVTLAGAVAHRWMLGRKLADQ